MRLNGFYLTSDHVNTSHMPATVLQYIIVTITMVTIRMATLHGYTQIKVDSYFTCYWHLQVSFNFDHMLSVGTISIGSVLEQSMERGEVVGLDTGYCADSSCCHLVYHLGRYLVSHFSVFHSTCWAITKHLSGIVSSQSHITNCQLQNSSTTLLGMRLTCSQEPNLIINLYT